jgi:hypothetical protein
VGICGRNGFFASRPVTPPVRLGNEVVPVPRGVVSRWREASEKKLEAAQVRKLRENSSTTFRGMDVGDREVLERLRREELRRVQEGRAQIWGDGTTVAGSAGGEGRVESKDFFDLERLRRLS